MTDEKLQAAIERMAAFVAEQRHSRGLSQVELAEKSGLGIATIRRIETAKFAPDGKSLIKLSEALGVKFHFPP